MTTTLAILASCALALAIATGFLLYHGKYGYRNMVWTMHMDREDR
jgi:hypothetical protein